jgi:hypothetical protein
MGELYCFFPQGNIVKKITSLYGEHPFYNYLARTTDDSVILTPRKEAFVDHLIVGIDKITVDVETQNIMTRTLLGKKRMPKAFRAFISPDETELYLFGKCFWVYDLERDTVRQVFDFSEILPGWPDDYKPYFDESYYGAPSGSPNHFITRHDGSVTEFCIFNDTKMVLIDVKSETFTVGNDHLEQFQYWIPDWIPDNE